MGNQSIIKEARVHNGEQITSSINNSGKTVPLQAKKKKIKLDYFLIPSTKKKKNELKTKMQGLKS